MTVYLHDIPLEEAKRHFEQALKNANLWGLLGVDEKSLSSKLVGRVIAEPVWAKISSPHYHASAMDGFCVRAEDTIGATQTSPVVLQVGKEANYLDTGDNLPEDFNAVIPIESIEPLDEADKITEEMRNPAKIRVRTAVVPWAHVRAMGEDMIATQLVLPSGHSIRPVDLGGIAGSGHDRVMVSRKPKVAVIPTGTELVKVGTPLNPGDIIEYNSIVMAAQIESWGGTAKVWEIVQDDFEEIKQQVLNAAKEHDLVLVNAGSSAGSEDFTSRVVEAIGELLVHGVAVRPGHPVILGIIHAANGRKVPIVGVPGYPVSAALTGEIFIEPLISRWLGRKSANPETIEAELTRKTTSPAGDDDFQRVVVGRVGDRVLAAPISKGAGVISSLVRADGIVVFPRGSQGEPAGTKVNVRLYRSRTEIDQTIFAIGSHDLTLDLMAQFLNHRDRRLTSANIGSLGGLVALRRDEAHLAGAHLLDPESGLYNLPYLEKYLPDTKVKVVALVEREQGLIVSPGNPKGIADLMDLTRSDIVYVNRQNGAGTRVLLDYHLGKLGIQEEEIAGYTQEEYTHLTVAAAVASGRADCGMGIAAAADAIGLDFIPLYTERYDLIVPEKYYKSDLMIPLWEVLASEDFRKMVLALPGYQVTEIGKVIN